jgi:hypothetical protein
MRFEEMWMEERAGGGNPESKIYSQQRQLSSCTAIVRVSHQPANAPPSLLVRALAMKCYGLRR